MDRDSGLPTRVASAVILENKTPSHKSKGAPHGRSRRSPASNISRRAHLQFLDLITDPAELAAFYAACDALALPSDSECFALVQVEAMCCGTPVVATEIPGARVVVRATGMGELVPPADPTALAAALLRVARHRASYVKPRHAIEAAFDLDHTVSEYERLLTAAARAAPS